MIYEEGIIGGGQVLFDVMTWMGLVVFMYLTSTLFMIDDGFGSVHAM